MYQLWITYFQTEGQCSVTEFYTFRLDHVSELRSNHSSRWRSVPTNFKQTTPPIGHLVTFPFVNVPQSVSQSALTHTNTHQTPRRDRRRCNLTSSQPQRRARASTKAAEGDARLQFTVAHSARIHWDRADEPECVFAVFMCLRSKRCLGECVAVCMCAKAQSQSWRENLRAK